MINLPKIAVVVLVRRNGQVLLGKRKNSHSEGTWAPPGGHLEMWETINEAAHREVAEETGLKIANLTTGPTSEDMFRAEGKHYVSHYIVADYASGEAEVLEPDKCEGWEWVSWDSIAQPRMSGLDYIIHTRFNPFNV